MHIELKRIMKKVFVFCVLFFMGTSFVFSQRITIKNIESRLVTNQGVEFVGELKDVDDHIYVFPTWKNYGVLYVDNKTYQLNNLNFNAETNSFESRLKKDQLFSYGKSSIDSVSINKHMFKKIGSSFYEVLYENGDNQFLKKHDVRYTRGEDKRLGGPKGETTVSIDYKYLIVSKDDFSKIELNKNSIIHLYESDEEKLKSFVKKERLSYKKEEDIVKIVEYMI